MLVMLFEIAKSFLTQAFSAFDHIAPCFILIKVKRLPQFYSPTSTAIRFTIVMPFGANAQVHFKRSRQ
jgi:hypothetical protein